MPELPATIEPPDDRQPRVARPGHSSSTSIPEAAQTMDLNQLARALFEEIPELLERLDAEARERILRQAVSHVPEDLVAAADAGDRTELELCLRTRLRNLTAFQTMSTQDYKHLTTKLTNVAYMYMHDWRMAEDAVQDTFLQMYKKRDNFRGDSSYYAWISRILFSRVMATRRGPVTKGAPPVIVSLSSSDRDSLARFLEDRADDSPSLEEKTAAREKLFKVWELISVLLTDKISFPALNLLFIQGYSYEETAKVLDISVEHLYTRVSQARTRISGSKAIRALLEDADE